MFIDISLELSFEVFPSSNWRSSHITWLLLVDVQNGSIFLSKLWNSAYYSYFWLFTVGWSWPPFHLSFQSVQLSGQNLVVVVVGCLLMKIDVVVIGIDLYCRFCCQNDMDIYCLYRQIIAFVVVRKRQILPLYCLGPRWMFLLLDSFYSTLHWVIFVVMFWSTINKDLLVQLEDSRTR